MPLFKRTSVWIVPTLLINFLIDKFLGEKKGRPKAAFLNKI
jgi:hypothetical protein